MNPGPLIFLAAFFGLAFSWFGFVLTPGIQVGRLQQTNTVPAGVVYPNQRPGLARQGLQVYRANGCAYCHSQQVAQTGEVSDLMLLQSSTNETSMLVALRKVRPSLSEAEDRQLLSGLPKAIWQGIPKEVAEAAVKVLNESGAKAVAWIVPTGPDMAQHWGSRRTVAEDFLFDYPVLPGTQRIGPDLANVGTRLPDANWQLVHLYAPRSTVRDSVMPPYRFLFEKRLIGREHSPDALALGPEFSPEPGYEIVPKPEAKALAAYLLSLRANEPLYDAPLSVAEAPAASTNATPAEAGSTNAPATNSIPK